LSAVALNCLASAAANTLYDVIGRAQTSEELDDLARLAWCGLRDGVIFEDDVHRLLEYVHLRRGARWPAPRQAILPGFPLPDPNRNRVSRFPKRRVQRSPDKQASYDRRHRLAFSGVMPPYLAAGLTIGEMAVLCVVAAAYRRTARCDLSLDEIAGRAGVCRKTAQRTMKEARDQHLISITEQPVPGQRHLPNLVTIISPEWLKWLRRPATDRVGGGGHLVAPTNKTSEDDCGDHRVQIAAPATAARSESGRPTKEAIELAAELANIAGYRQEAAPKSWQEADPPQVVQVWLNELSGNGQPIEALRTVAAKVMRRKRLLSDASPPYSPRYFSAEVKKLVARAPLQPRRDPARRVASGASKNG
jgi:hypothetical protein